MPFTRQAVLDVAREVCGLIAILAFISTATLVCIAMKPLPMPV